MDRIGNVNYLSIEQLFIQSNVGYLFFVHASNFSELYIILQFLLLELNPKDSEHLLLFHWILAELHVERHNSNLLALSYAAVRHNFKLGVAPLRPILLKWEQWGGLHVFQSISVGSWMTLCTVM